MKTGAMGRPFWQTSLGALLHRKTTVETPGFTFTAGKGSASISKHSRLHVEDVFDALRCGCARRLGRLAVALLGPGHLDLLPGALSPLCGGQRGGRGCGAGWGGVVVDELDLGRGGHRGRGRL